MNIQCDKCKKIINKEETTEIIRPYLNSMMEHESFLCMNCSIELNEWLKEKTK